MTHIWATRDSEETILSSNSKSIAIPTTSLGQFVPQRHPSPQMAENYVTMFTES
jgi:hypothetical protein